MERLAELERNVTTAAVARASNDAATAAAVDAAAVAGPRAVDDRMGALEARLAARIESEVGTGRVARAPVLPAAHISLCISLTPPTSSRNRAGWLAKQTPTPSDMAAIAEQLATLRTELRLVQMGGGGGGGGGGGAEGRRGSATAAAGIGGAGSAAEYERRLIRLQDAMERVRANCMGVQERKLNACHHPHPHHPRPTP